MAESVWDTAPGVPAFPVEPLAQEEFLNPGQRAWLEKEETRLITFPSTFVSSRGSAPFLNFQGNEEDCETPTFISARLAYVGALAALRGNKKVARETAQLVEYLNSIEDAGWNDRADLSVEHPKSMYTLAFVILASATAALAGVKGSNRLLRRALLVYDAAFWEEENGLAIDRRYADGSPGSYRGMNANMHLVEALLAASAATHEGQWSDRAVRICDFVLADARNNNWRIHEHFDAKWAPLPEHNHAKPDHAYVPYGSTIGHGYEWARLIAQSTTLVESTGRLAGAESLYERATKDGWFADGDPGFLYTTDWEGLPVSRQRLHWVPSEALACAAVLARLTGKATYVSDFERWRAHIADHFVDRENGSWFHALDPMTLKPLDVHGSKPDLYHTYQMALVGQLPVRASVGQSILDARADTMCQPGRRSTSR